MPEIGWKKLFDWMCEYCFGADFQVLQLSGCHYSGNPGVNALFIFRELQPFYFTYESLINIVFPFKENGYRYNLVGDIVCWVENGGKYVQVKLTNIGEDEYYNPIAIYSRDNEVAKTYATVPAGGSTLLTFQYSTNTNKYEYNIIKVTDFRGNVIVNKKEVFGNGVDNVEADKLSISSLNGSLLVSSSADGRLVIYNSAGQIVTAKQISSFSPEMIALPAGVYFVNGRKAIVY